MPRQIVDADIGDALAAIQPELYQALREGLGVRVRAGVSSGPHVDAVHWTAIQL